MKAELKLPPELVDQIADRVIEKMRPLLPASHNCSDDLIMDIKEAADFLRTSKAQIYQWTNNAKHGLGTFPYYKAGKQLRFSRNDLITWMERNKSR